MSNNIIIKKKINPKPKGLLILKKMLEDRKFISQHLKNGGTFKELKEKGYKFETV